ncbi:TonB-dependent receptor [Aurantiacibacter gilvus]|uniref:TonB-dependent receptor n=1 Tax=Aurantiacibacter gilvus TaxID=3139141 RepID=A0ABU9IF71_9SPHN
MSFSAMKVGLLSSVFTGTAMFAAPAAHGQDGPAEAEQQEQGSTIYVTARKREEDLIDVPLPVTVATQEQLNRDQVYSLNDLQRITPALEISQTSGGESNGGGRLRGVGTGVFNPSVASSVALVIDQVPVGNMSFPQLFDMAQVEVLRGPQGTLFGQGASAGVLNVTTRAPVLGEFGMNASVDWADKGTVGSEVGEWVINAGVNVPLGQIGALRVATQFKEETGLQHSVTTGQDNVIQDWGLRGRLLLEPSDALTINLNAEYAQNTSDGQTFFAVAIAPNATTPFGPPGATIGGISTGAYTDPAGCAMPVIDERAEFYCENDPSYLRTEVQAYSAVFDLDLSDDLSVTSVTSYRARRFDQEHRDFSRILPAPAAQQNLTREDANGLSQELRLSYVGDTFDFVAGGFYQDFEFDRIPLGGVFGSNLPGERVGFSVCNPGGTFCPVGNQFTDELTENRTLALFADATVQVSEVVSIFGGLRLDDYKNTTTVQTFPAIPGNAGGPNGTAGTFVTEDSNISGRIGVSFQPNPDTNIFASYSRGYKPPAVGTNPAGQLFQLEPEKANAFELGARFNIGDVQLSGNVFYNELLDFQSQTSVFVGTALVSQPLNIDQIESYGFEVGAVGEILPGWVVNAGYQFNNITFPSGYVGDDGGNLGGTQFLNAPRHKFTLSSEFSTPVTESIEFFVNANLVYKSDVLLAARADDRFRYPAHELINGGLGIRDADGGWNLSVFVRNLTEEREPTAYLASTFAGRPDGGIRAWPVAGLTARVVGIRAGFEF